MHNIVQIDCAILSHEGKHFVFPTLSLAEIIPVERMHQPIMAYSNVNWKKYSLPLLTLDVAPFLVSPAHRGKIAIVHALFSTACQSPPYFALYFNGLSWRKKLTTKTIQWTNSEKKEADIIEKNERLPVIIVDVFQLSQKAEVQLS